MIEDVINDVLSGAAKVNALNLVAYLRANKLNPKLAATNAFKVSSKTFTVCFIRFHGSAAYNNMGPGEWGVCPFIGEYEADALPDDMREIAWANKKHCQTCGQCALPVSSIFGRKFLTSCECSISFKNPNAEEIECTKKLIELRRDAIKTGAAKKHVYVAIKDR